MLALRSRAIPRRVPAMGTSWSSSPCSHSTGPVTLSASMASSVKSSANPSSVCRLKGAMPDQGVLAVGPPDLLVPGEDAGVDRVGGDDVHADQRRDPLHGSDHRAG